MKNIFKIAFVALAVSLTVSACGSKQEEAHEAPAVDTAKVDSAKVDSAAHAAGTAAPAPHGH